MEAARNNDAEAPPAALPDNPPVSASEDNGRPYPGRTNSLLADRDRVAPARKLESTEQRFDFKAAFLQSLGFTVFNHAWRVGFDPSLRYMLVHKPFFHDWFVSYQGYNLHRWNDGDDFIVNDVGHPLQGAVFSRIFLQNDPRSFVRVSKTRDYWVPRLQSMAWSAAWEVQWKVGPLSETSLGNAGGWEYVNGCGTALSCLNNPKYPGPPTNNTGLTDWIVTPVVGFGWVLGEDTLERFIVVPVARNHRIFGGRILRSCLEPSKDMAAAFMGKFPWMLPSEENNFVVATRPKPPKLDSDGDDALSLQRWEIGIGYTNVSLPVVKDGCTGCRQNNSGVGSTFDFNLTRGFGVDSSVNLLPGQGGSEGMTQGQFGVRWGERWRRWGLFAKVRPGFIYYQKALPGRGVYTPDSLTRFTWDFGGIVEIYPHRNSTLRFDAGTTMVRYLANYEDPRTSHIQSNLSTQFMAVQGNLQISTSYSWRF